MIRIDRKTCRDILRVTKRYDNKVFFHPDISGYCLWSGAHPKHASVVSSVPVSEVFGSLNRLNDQKLIEKQMGVMGNGMIFCITPELLHYKAFWFDRFTRTFLAGFLSGIATSVVAGLVLHFLIKLF